MFITPKNECLDTKSSHPAIGRGKLQYKKNITFFSIIWRSIKFLALKCFAMQFGTQQEGLTYQGRGPCVNSELHFSTQHVLRLLCGVCFIISREVCLLTRPLVDTRQSEPAVSVRGGGGPSSSHRPGTSSGIETYLSSTGESVLSAKISRSLLNICYKTKYPPTAGWRKTAGRKQQQMQVLFFFPACFFIITERKFTNYGGKNPIARLSTVFYQPRCFWLQMISTSTLMANKKGNLHFIIIKVKIKGTFFFFPPPSSSCCSLTK